MDGTTAQLFDAHVNDDDDAYIFSNTTTVITDSKS